MAVDIKISPENILAWSDMEDWVENGTSAAPTGHVLSGGSATVARESTIIKKAVYSAKVTRVGADATLYHDHIDFADYEGRKMTFGCWVYATVASRARIAISDGVGSTNSSYHTGDSTWQFLTVTHDVDSSNTRLRAEMHVNTGNTAAYFDGGVLCEGTDTFYVLTDNVDIERMTPTDTFRGQKFRVAGRGGITLPEMQIEAKSIKLDGEVIGATPTAARTVFDALAKALNSHVRKPNGEVQRKDLYLFDDRRFQGVLDNFKPKSRAALKSIQFSAKFTVPEPYSIATNMTRSKTTLSSSPTTLTVTTAGTAFARPLIEITAGGANITALTVENLTTDQSFSFTGTIATTKKLIIDTDFLTVENDGANGLSTFSGDPKMILYPGANEFKITFTGGSTDSVARIDWFDRWF